MSTGRYRGSRLVGQLYNRLDPNCERVHNTLNWNGFLTLAPGLLIQPEKRNRKQGSRIRQTRTRDATCGQQLRY